MREGGLLDDRLNGMVKAARLGARWKTVLVGNWLGNLEGQRAPSIS
jgi:hypothetical protein